MNTIPLVDLKANYQSIRDEIDEAIHTVLQDQSFILGEEVKVFEEEFAHFNKSKYAVGVSNGTDGLHLCLLALNIGKGDEVITTPSTFMATLEAIIYCGATPILADIDPRTGNISYDEILKQTTKKTKAIIPVHMYGAPCDMEKIMKYADRHSLSIVEDCSHAHGALYKNKMVGNFGDASCFSLFPAKILGAYGDAGVIVTNTQAIYQKLLMLRDHGRISKHEHIIIGYNARLDTLQASILCVKLRHIQKWISNRRKWAHYYTSHLSSIVQTPLEIQEISPSYYMYVIRTEKRDLLIEFLKKRRISTGIHYPTPLHLQKACLDLGYKKGDFPDAEKWAKQIISLPLYPELTQQTVDYVIESIKLFFKKPSKKN